MEIIKILISELPQFAKGTLVALQLLAGLLSVGLVLGLAIALAEIFGNPVLKFLATTLRKFLWAIPQLILLFLVFYLPFDLNRMVAAIIALGLCSSAFQSQIFRGAILSVSSGQMEAAKAMGLSRPRTILYIVLPQMVRLSIGPWTNEFSSELKDTSLAYVVGVVEIMRNAKYIIAYTYGNTAAVYLFVGVLYFTLTRIGTFFFYKLEDRLWVPGFEKRS
ncbi:MAG: amino acid ABC transporter permease [Desulfobacterium sp.]|jgi:polar amino acid transport system permease protein|nr:amino acid ABC transporter permease [Desulfobacterium sp.]